VRLHGLHRVHLLLLLKEFFARFATSNALEVGADTEHDIRARWESCCPEDNSEHVSYIPFEKTPRAFLSVDLLGYLEE